MAMKRTQIVMMMQESYVYPIQPAITPFTFTLRDNNLYKSCILFTEFNSPSNLVRDKGIYSTLSIYVENAVGNQSNERL